MTAIVTDAAAKRARVSEVALTALWAVAITAVVQGVSISFGFDPTDEGFLWYGVEQTATGAVPLRDFQAYEPGRYYWGAIGTSLLGPGIASLRISLAVFGALGLFFGMRCTSRVLDTRFEGVVAGLVLAAWMAPRHKIIDSALAMTAVWFALRLAEDPSLRRHAAAGAFVGVAAFFGRNHALYAGLGIASTALVVAWHGRDVGVPRKGLAALAGAGVGALPLIAMLLFVPGFAASFFESVWFFVERGSNHPLSVPWPWTLDFADWDWWTTPADLAVGTGYLGLIGVYGAGLLAIWWGRTAPRSGCALLVASTCVGVFYAHHAMVRSDAAHLAQCIDPMWLGAFALRRSFSLPREASRVVLLVAAALTWFALPAIRPVSVAALPGGPSIPFERFTARGVDVEIPEEQARELIAVVETISASVPAGDSIFIAPIAPGLYPLLGRTSPTWGIYFLWPGSEADQREMLADLDAVDWALLQRGRPFDREDLVFANSHPLVAAYLARTFAPVPARTLPAGFTLLRRK